MKGFQPGNCHNNGRWAVNLREENINLRAELARYKEALWLQAKEIEQWRFSYLLHYTINIEKRVNDALAHAAKRLEEKEPTDV